MRLQQYLNETEIENPTPIQVVEMIKKDCKPFLGEFNKPLYRGSPDEDMVSFGVKSPRKGRHPMNTSRKTHDIFDKALDDIFGWKGRSEGLFVSNDYYVARSYGDGMPYMIFPIGKYKYIYSEFISDFFVTRDKIFTEGDGDATDYEVVRSNVKKLYTDKNLNIIGCKEVMLKCDTYYYLKYDAIDKKTIYDELGIKI